MTDHKPPLTRFRGLVRQLLAEGVKPTPTAFEKRGWGYTQGKGSGCTWSHGRYTAARREELLAAGWTYRPHPNARYEGQGVWVPPVQNAVPPMTTATGALITGHDACQARGVCLCPRLRAE